VLSTLAKSWAGDLPERGREAVIEDARKELRAAIEDLRSVRNRLSSVQVSIPPSAEETSGEDLKGDPDAATELRAVIGSGIQDCLDPLIQSLLAATK
jgi:hypothetical protein